MNINPLKGKDKPTMKNFDHECYPVALTIAGSDSGGGAGIQADLRTFNAFGVFGCSAITAITSQNPLAVRRIDPLPPEAVAAQLAAVFEAVQIGCIKTGMLGGAATIQAVAEGLTNRPCKLVVDPVMVATSGARLLPDEALEVLRTVLLPLADWLTPNLPEAELLLGRPLRQRDEMRRGAQECAERWQCSCVLKGGHAAGDRDNAVDIVAHDGKLYELSSPRIAVEKYCDHGTGCTFSAALAAGLALDMPWKKALASAKGFVLGSLAEAVQIGPKLQAMYPPEEAWYDRVELRRITI